MVRFEHALAQSVSEPGGPGLRQEILAIRIGCREHLVTSGHPPPARGRRPPPDALEATQSSRSTLGDLLGPTASRPMGPLASAESGGSALGPTTSNPAGREASTLSSGSALGTTSSRSPRYRSLRLCVRRARACVTS